jgi:putative cardiolipin synthase
MTWIRVLVWVSLAWTLQACTSLPPADHRRSMSEPISTDGTTLARALAPEAAAHPGLSGVFPLADALDAFAARALLAQAAERTLDVQYYIWRKDTSGMLLFAALRQAADRGVRVRLLLDDNSTQGLDEILSALDAHMNIEVRLFNPFAIRWPRAIGYLTDFQRLNRRMHNKSFTADSQATIVGGRNVGDEYFGATDGAAFVDLDVLAIGQVVSAVSADFERYWSSRSSYPLHLLVPPVESGAARLPEANGPDSPIAQRDTASAEYLGAVRRAPLVRDLLQGRLRLDWAPTQLVSDDPAKVLGQGHSSPLLPQLSGIIGRPVSRVQLVSAYFVPGKAGTDAFVAMARRGVEVSVLTNSLEATDVPIVHAGYAKRRKTLLNGGVKLYELRRQIGALDDTSRRLRTLVESSSSSLHAKTFTVDGSHVFIGSFNFDPRSIHLNTEMGLVVRSASLARQSEAAFERASRQRAYEVRLDDQGELYWLHPGGAQVMRHATEPGTRAWQRAAVWFLSLMPIEWLL